MRWFARWAVLVSLAFPAPAAACGPCETGDPTLASPTWSLPYRGRVRLSVEGRWSSEATSRDGATLRTDAVDVVPAISGSPVDRLTLALRVPLSWRRVAHPNLELEEVVALGDPEARVGLVVLRDRPFAPSHVLMASVAVDVPVAPAPTSERGNAVSHEAQASSGSVDTTIALDYAYRGPPWAVLVSLGWRFPTTGTGGLRAGASTEGGVTAQWQPLPEIAIRLGVDARYALPSRENERVVEDTGGFVLRAAPEIAFAPVADLYVALGVRLPVITAMSGARSDGPVVSLVVAGEIGR